MRCAPSTEEVRRVARGEDPQPEWIEGMKEHGYKGAGEISKRVGYVYGWQATSRQVDGAHLRRHRPHLRHERGERGFFQEHNPWAMEEIGSRLIEAEERGLWGRRPTSKTR